MATEDPYARLRAKLAEMELVEDGDDGVYDPFDAGYMMAIREIREWLTAEDAR